LLLPSRYYFFWTQVKGAKQFSSYFRQQHVDGGANKLNARQLLDIREFNAGLIETDIADFEACKKLKFLFKNMVCFSPLERIPPLILKGILSRRTQMSMRRVCRSSF